MFGWGCVQGFAVARSLLRGVGGNVNGFVLLLFDQDGGV